MKAILTILILLAMPLCGCTRVEREYIEVINCTEVNCVLSDNDSLLRCAIEQKKMLKVCTKRSE